MLYLMYAMLFPMAFKTLVIYLISHLVHLFAQALFKALQLTYEDAILERILKVINLLIE